MKKQKTVKVQESKKETPVEKKDASPKFVRMETKEFVKRFVVFGKPLPPEAKEFASPGMMRYYGPQRMIREAKASPSPAPKSEKKSKTSKS